MNKLPDNPNLLYSLAALIYPKDTKKALELIQPEDLNEEDALLLISELYELRNKCCNSRMIKFLSDKWHNLLFTNFCTHCDTSEWSVPECQALSSIKECKI